MRYLTLGEILVLYERLLALSGGRGGIRDLGALESAVAQPRMTFAGQDLYPDLVTKATALAYSSYRIIRSWMATSERAMPRSQPSSS